MFESFWLSTSFRLKLPPKCTARWAPDDSLLEYDASPKCDSDIGSVPDLSYDDESPPENPLFTPSLDEDDPDYISPEAAAFARQLGPSDASENDDGAGPCYTPVSTTHTFINDASGLGRGKCIDEGYVPTQKTLARKTPAKPKAAKVPKAKTAPKARKALAKTKSPRVEKRSLENGAGEGMGGAHREVALSSPAKRARKVVDGGARQRKQSAKAMAMGERQL